MCEICLGQACHRPPSSRPGPLTAYGHFGRTDVDLPWERLDMVDALRAEAAAL